MNISQVLTSLKNKLVPQLAEAISQKEAAVKLTAELYDKAEQIIPIFDKINTLVYNYDQAKEDGEITIQEGKQLLSNLKEIASDPAVADLREFLEGYTCLSQ